MGRHLEATDKPIEYRLKTGEEVTLRPGVQMEVPGPSGNPVVKEGTRLSIILRRRFQRSAAIISAAG